MYCSNEREVQLERDASSGDASCWTDTSPRNWAMETCIQNQLAFLQKFLGVVRLIVEDGHLVLRGMMIAPTHQRKGIGSLMLKELEKHIGSQDCYCLPHGWLEGFYGQIGFVKINDDQAPRHLQDRLKENRRRHAKLIAMKRVAS